MHFSKTAEYAIRVLSYLYRHHETSHSVNVLHQKLDLPYKYLTKMVTDLVKMSSAELNSAVFSNNFYVS